MRSRECLGPTWLRRHWLYSSCWRMQWMRRRKGNWNAVNVSTHFKFPSRFDYRAVRAQPATSWQKHLGHRRPYHHPLSSESIAHIPSDCSLSSSVPDGCNVVSVQALIRFSPNPAKLSSRHGARNPTQDEWPDLSKITQVRRLESPNSDT